MARTRPPLVWTFVALASAAVFAFPLLAMVAVALQPPDVPLGPGALLPTAPTLASFARAFAEVPLARSLLNSLLVCAVAVPVSLAVASAGGLSIALSARRRLWLLALILAMSVPASAMWLPRFWLFKTLGLVDTGLPLVAPALLGGAPLVVLLYAVAFSRVPRELFDAALLEGASAIRVWWQVALPVVRPTTAGAGIVAFLLFWNNLVDPLLYLSSEARFTAPLMLRLLELLGPTNWPVLLAGSAIVTLPPAVLFWIARRWLFEEERMAGWLGR